MRATVSKGETRGNLATHIPRLKLTLWPKEAVVFSAWAHKVTVGMRSLFGERLAAETETTTGEGAWLRSSTDRLHLQKHKKEGENFRKQCLFFRVATLGTFEDLENYMRRRFHVHRTFSNVVRGPVPGPAFFFDMFPSEKQGVVHPKPSRTPTVTELANGLVQLFEHNLKNRSGGTQCLKFSKFANVSCARIERP